MKKIVIGIILTASFISVNAYEVLNSSTDSYNYTTYTIKCNNGKIDSSLTNVGSSYSASGSNGTRSFSSLDAAARYQCDE